MIRAAASRLALAVHAASLDAPLVAAVWQSLLAGVFGLQFAFADMLLLPAGVWLAYCGDRLIDARRMPTSRRLRHVFCRRHRQTLIVVWFGVAFAAFAFGAVRLDPTSRYAAGAMLAVLAIYLGATQRWRGLRRVVPREVVVGILFALGTALFLAPGIGGARPGAWILATLSLAGLCVLDCFAVSWLERFEDQRDGEPTAASPSGARAPAIGLVFAITGIAAAIGVLGLLLEPTRPRIVFACAVASSYFALTILLCAARRRPETELARLGPWTDFALVLPASLLLFV